MVQRRVHWEATLPVFLESTVFWLYLNYVGLAFRRVLDTPLLLVSSWDPVLKLFTCSFLTDYLWRRFLSVGNCIDAATPLIAIAQGNRNGDFWPVFVGCTFSGVVTFLVSEAILPVAYAKWHRHRGLLFCFLVELMFDFIHQARYAAHFIVTTRFQSLAGFEAKQKALKCKRSADLLATNSNKQSDRRNPLKSSSISSEETVKYRIKARGIQATASFITASIVAFGSYFSTGGPMLNLTYTIMAALAHRDWTLLVVLGTANLLGAYFAGLYVKMDIEGTTEEGLATIPEGISSSTLIDRTFIAEGVDDQDQVTEEERKGEDTNRESKKDK